MSTRTLSLPPALRACSHSPNRAHEPAILLLPVLLPGPKPPLLILGWAVGMGSISCLLCDSNPDVRASVLPSVKWA